MAAEAVLCLPFLNTERSLDAKPSASIALCRGRLRLPRRACGCEDASGLRLLLLTIAVIRCNQIDVLDNSY